MHYFWRIIWQKEFTGDLLAAFPELFQNVPYYEREPKVGAGYIEKASGLVDVIIMPEKTFSIAIGGRSMSEASADVLDIKDKEYVWADHTSPLTVGTFLYDLEKGRLVRLIGRAEWGHYGGFTRFDFEIVQGTTSEPDRTTASIIKGKF